MHKIWQDFLYALRQLRKSPGFAVTAVLSLALGIGATTAVFSVVYGVLMNPYPYADQERLVHLILKDKAGRDNWPGFTGPQIQRLQQARCLENLSAEDEWNLTTSGEGLPEDVNAIYFSAKAFEHFGVAPLLGREFGVSDAPDGQEPQPVVVLGYSFWQRHYSGDPEIIGHTIDMVHKRYTVIGVLPARFAWGDGDVYLPLKLTADPKKTFSVNLRLKNGVPYAAANSELEAIVQQFAKEDANHFPKSFHVKVRGLNEQFEREIGKTLLLLLGAVGLLLLIGCGNVSILLLARGTMREHEFAVRAAVGAGRSRILAQLLTEALVLGVAGAGFGVLLAYRAVEFITAWLPEYSFPHEAAIAINLPVLLFSASLAVATSILFGLSPAISLSRPEIAQVIQANTRKASGGGKSKRTHNVLIAGQIALTVILMTAAGAALGGFFNLMHTSLGYDPHNTMSVGIPVHDNTHLTWEQRAHYFDQIRERLGTLPAVISSGISTNATPPSNGWETNFEIFGRPANEDQQLRVNLISPEYFSVLHIPLEKGRLWDHAETMRAAKLAVINQTMARRYWPNGDALGHQVRIPKMKSDSPNAPAAEGSDTWLQVVGVVADARDDGLRKPIRPAVYVPYTLTMRPWTQILVRTKVPPLTILRSIRAQVAMVDSDQQVIGNPRDLDHWISTQPEWAQQRLIATLFGVFAVLALGLAAVGLYSVVSYAVAQRTNEIGIRMSLGARQNHVLQLVFSSTAISVGAGLAAGVVVSLGLSRVWDSWAEGSSHDPLILPVVALLLAVTAAAACFFPARRASAVDPMIALRCQ
jgi:predicted permease